MKIFVAHASAFDYEQKLYAPLRAFAKAEGHEVVLPHEQGETWNTHDAIASSDVFILEASVPSTGAGIEAGWAHAAGIPIIALHEKESAPSTVVPLIARMVISYESQEDLVAQVSTALSSLRLG